MEPVVQFLLAGLFLLFLLSLAWLLRARVWPAAASANGPRAQVDEIDPTDEARFVHIDQEELIEGSWDFFLPDLQRLLGAEGVTFEPVVTRSESELSVRLNGEVLLAMNAVPVSEAEAEEAANAAIVRLARAVNRRLERADSAKRLFFLEGWNDLGGTLLRPNEFSALEAGDWGEALWDADDGLEVAAPMDVRHMLCLGPQPVTRGGHFFYVRIPGDIGPIDRGRLYEDPLDEALAAGGLGGVTGGGTQLGTAGTIEYCGIDIDVQDREVGLACILRVLRERGAPPGTVIEEYDPVNVAHPVWDDEP